MRHLRAVPPLLLLAGMLSCTIPSPPAGSTPVADGSGPTDMPGAIGQVVLTQASSSANGASDWSALDRVLQDFVPSRIGGLTFILSVDGEVVFQKALGSQSMDSVLPIASATKMPSALVVLTLVEDGLLDLDAPVGAYFQGQIAWPDDKAAITTRMLLNHTSGLVGAPSCLGQRGSTTLQACAHEIADAPLEFPPGTQFAYGGGGYQVAGYLAEVVGGRSWNEMFSERLAQPLGLSRFTYSGGTLGSEANPRIAGGASSDVYDYNRLLQMILNQGTQDGIRILSRPTVQMMAVSQISGLPRLRSPGEDDLLLGYSFGFWISDPSLHPGSLGPELSDQGAFGCTPWVDLDRDYSAVLLIQDRTRTGTEIWNSLRPIIIAALNGAP